MRDFLGHEIQVGDRVVALEHSRTSSQLVRARVVGFTATMVKLEVPHSYRQGETEEVKKSPYKVVVDRRAECAKARLDLEYLLQENERLQQRVSDMGWQLNPEGMGR